MRHCGNGSATTIRLKIHGDGAIYLMLFADGKERNFSEFTAEFSRNFESDSVFFRTTPTGLGPVTMQGSFSERDEWFDMKMLLFSRKMRRHWRMLKHKMGQLYLLAQTPDESWSIIEPGVDLIASSIRFREEYANH